jgi:hypothetical protein
VKDGLSIAVGRGMYVIAFDLACSAASPPSLLSSHSIRMRGEAFFVPAQQACPERVSRCLHLRVSAHKVTKSPKSRRITQKCFALRRAAIMTFRRHTNVYLHNTT